MKESEIRIGQRVRSTFLLSGVPKGTEGVVDEDYKTGIMIAWDLPKCRLPAGYKEFDHQNPGPFKLRDGFRKSDELDLLEVVR